MGLSHGRIRVRVRVGIGVRSTIMARIAGTVRLKMTQWHSSVGGIPPVSARGTRTQG